MINSGRVVVTGVGVVSPIGLNANDFWESLRAGQSGVSKIEGFDTSRYHFDRHRGGEIKNFEAPRYFDVEYQKFGRSSQMAMVASKECLEDAGLRYDEPNFQIGVAFGTTMGESQILEKIDDLWYAGTAEDVPASLPFFYPAWNIPRSVAKYLRLYGPSMMLPNACAAGNMALAHGFDCIREGKAEAMIVGGSDCFSRYFFAGFCRLGAVAPDVPRPFDKNRQGMIPSEGAGALLIEAFDHAKARNAKPYAEVLSYGVSCDAHHMTKLYQPGLVQSYRNALKMANVRPEEVSYICVHGTGTDANDSVEGLALKEVFGELLRSIPISSIKSMLGHTMGAASAMECVACVLAIKNQFIPPTANFETLDPIFEEALDVVPNKGRPHEVNVVLNLASAFGGSNSVTVFRKIEPW